MTGYRRLSLKFYSALFLVGALSLGTTACMNSGERSLLDRTNAMRASRGLPPLADNERLDAKARSWASAMAGQASISHSQLANGLAGLRWRHLGENVAMVSTRSNPMAAVHNAFVASPGHHANLVNPGYNAMGIGVARGRDGAIYVSEVFAQIDRN